MSPRVRWWAGVVLEGLGAALVALVILALFAVLTIMLQPPS